MDEGELKQKPSGMKGRLKSASNKVASLPLSTRRRRPAPPISAPS